MIKFYKPITEGVKTINEYAKNIQYNDFTEMKEAAKKEVRNYIHKAIWDELVGYFKGLFFALGITLITNTFFWIYFLLERTETRVHISYILIAVIVFILKGLLTEYIPEETVEHINNLREVRNDLFTKQLSPIWDRIEAAGVNFINRKREFQIPEAKPIFLHKKDLENYIKETERFLKESSIPKGSRNMSLFSLAGTIAHTVNQYSDNLPKSVLDELDVLYKQNPLTQELYEAIGAEFEKTCKAIKIGDNGEHLVNKVLSNYEYALSNHENIILPSTNSDIKTAEIDNLIVSPYGIFAIEVKNWGEESNLTIKIEKDGRWSKVISKKGQDELIPIKNITEQNYHHISAVESLINKNIKPEKPIKVHSIIVFANENVNIQNHSDNIVLRPSNIYQEISKRDVVLGREEIEEINALLEENRLPENKFPYPNYLQKIKDLNEYLQKVNQLAIETGVTEEVKKLYIFLQETVKKDESN